MQTPLVAATKRNTFRLYLSEEDTQMMKRAADATELGQSELMSKLMAAALRAVAENHYSFSLPLRFQILPKHCETLNEPAKYRR